MTLPPVVGLVVEEMRQRRAELLGHRLGIGDRRIGEVRRQLRLGERVDPAGDPPVLGRAGA